MDLEQIRKNYADFDDFKIEYLAKNEAGSLEPEVLEILQNEVIKRGLNRDLIMGIEAQTKELSEDELNEIESKIINLPCPECGKKNLPLKGTLIRTVRSFIVFTMYKRVPIISCNICADKKRKDALITTLLLGWWCPWGLFRTPQAIIATISDRKMQEVQSKAILNNFIFENIGEIKTNWEKENDLIAFIHHINSQQ